MILKLFTQPNCPKCPSAKKLLAEFKSQKSKVKTEEYDVSTVNGLAEASFYTVMATPTLLLCDDGGKIAKDWRGETPTLLEITAYLK